MLTEWVLVSLPNFTRRAPLSYSLWCLSCFFLAASPNPWLQVSYQHKLTQTNLCHFSFRSVLIFSLGNVPPSPAQAAFRQLKQLSRGPEAVLSGGLGFLRRPHWPAAEGQVHPDLRGGERPRQPLHGAPGHHRAQAGQGVRIHEMILIYASIMWCFLYLWIH